MFASQLAPILAFLGFLLFIPRSPRWLAQKGRFEEALAVISRFNSPDQAAREMADIRASLAEEKGTFSELLQPGVRKALFIGICLGIFQQWTGWSAMAYYVPTLFAKAGFSRPSDAIFQSIIVNGWAGIVTLTAVLVVDRLGRRPLWIAGSGTMIAAMIVIGLAFKCNFTGLPLLFAFFFCAAPHAFALGPLPWLMMSELYPTRIRATAVAITTTALWAAAWLSPMVFPILMGYFERRTGSIAPAFWLFSGICVVALFFGLKILPETKARTLEDIARSFGATSRT
jgi:SP family arabinose:H+ symporter-like MFS transporter